MMSKGELLRLFICFLFSVALVRVVMLNELSSSFSGVDGSAWGFGLDGGSSFVRNAPMPPKEASNISNAIAIVSYIPNTLKFVREVRHMVHPSWHYGARRNQEMPWLREGHYKLPKDGMIGFTKGAPRERIDLLLFVDPKAVSQMPNDCLRVDSEVFGATRPEFDENDIEAGGKMRDFIAETFTGSGGSCFVIEHAIPKADLFNKINYKFMFSMSYLIKPRYKSLLTSYELLLRTDGDVFISPSLWHLRLSDPGVFIAGHGWYGNDYTFQRLDKVAARLGLVSQGVHNIGSSWVARPEKIIEVANLTIYAGEKMLATEFDFLQKPKNAQVVDEPGTPWHGKPLGWPYWHRGVTLLYASEIAINHLIQKPHLHIEKSHFDYQSVKGRRISQLYHIHVWQVKGRFNKANYTRYKPYEYPGFHRIEPSQNPGAKDYATFIALYYSVATSGTFPYKPPGKRKQAPSLKVPERNKSG